MSKEIEPEEALCRICRSGSEDDQILFHPCKCSGSIMFTHQDCLLEWLKHSKKKHCELCGYPFVFRRKYKSNMPQGALPIHHYLRMMVSNTIGYTLLGLRALLVATCWLGILPIINIYVWRTYFRFVDMIALFVLNSEPLKNHPLGMKNTTASTSTSTLGSDLAANATSIVSDVLSAASNASSATPTVPSTSAGPQVRIGLPSGLLSWAERFGSSKSGRIVNSLMKDCFEGQILTCSIVILFISIFLLREWILQNIPQPPPAPEAEAPVVPTREEREAALRRLQQAAAAQAAVQEAAAAPRPVPTSRVAGSESSSLNGSSSPAERPTRPLPVRAQDSFTNDNLPQDAKTLRDLRLAHFQKDSSNGEGSSKTTMDEKESGKIQDSAFSSEQKGKGKEKAMDGVGYFGDELPNYGTEALHALEDSNSSSKQREDSFSSFEGTAPPSPTESFKLDLEKPNAFSNLFLDGDRRTSPASRKGSRSSRSPSRQFKSVAQKESEPLQSTKDRSPSQVAPTGFKFDFSAPPSPSDRIQSRSDPESLDDASALASSSSSFQFAWSPPASSEPPTVPTSGSTKLQEKAFWDSLEKGQTARTINTGPVIDLEREAKATATSNSLSTHQSHGATSQPSNQEAASAAFSDPEKGSREPASSDGLERAPLEDEQPSSVAVAPDSPELQITSDADQSEDDHYSNADSEAATELGWDAEDNDDGWEDESEAARDEDDVGVIEMGDEEDEEDAEIEEWEQAEAAADEADVEGEGFREELEGIFEAVGLRGPILGIFTNVALIGTLCSLFLSVFVALPYLFGKLCGPVEVFQALTFPIQLIRFFTDPMFEGMFMVAKYLLRPLIALMNKTGVSSKVGTVVSKVIEKLRSSPSSQSDLSGMMHFTGQMQVGKNILSNVQARAPSWLSLPSSLSSLELDLKNQIEFFLDLPETVVHTLKALDAKRFGVKWTDRLFCVTLGHAFVAFYLTLHTNLAKWAGYTHMNWTQNWMKQQYLISKVLFFIIIELMLFPLCCGFLLNLCIYPLLSNEPPSLFQWLTVSGIFAHWLCGTLYMFCFAQLVGITRKTLRSGALCFIRDPQDPNYHPVKEILEKSALLQLRKIGTSAIMYAMICFLLVGFNVHGVRLVFKSVLPLRWKPYEPLSDVPYDLLALHILLPYVVARARPAHAFRSLCRKFWIHAASCLRLTSYLIGGRPEEEEGYYASKSWTEWFKLNFRRVFVSNPTGKVPEHLSSHFVRDGGLARVPADDHNTLYGPILIPVDSSGAPTTEEAVTALQKQLDGIAKAGRATAPKYTVIYTPPHFRRRVIILLGLLWLCLSLGIIAITVVPLSVGRFCFSLAGLHELHDTYPFTLGLLFLWGANRLRKSAVSSMAFLKRKRSDPRLASKLFKRIAKTTSNNFKIFYLISAFAVVLPILLGLTLYQYIIAPFRFVDYNVPEVSLAQLWALGLITESLFVRSFRGREPMQQHLRQIYDNGLRRPEIRQASRNVIFPFCIGLVSLISLPGVLVWVGMNVVRPAGRSAPLDQIWLRTVHLFIISTAIFCKLTMIIIKRMSTWTQSLRDELFLESTELRNYSSTDSTEKGDSDDDNNAQEFEGPVPDLLLNR